MKTRYQSRKLQKIEYCWIFLPQLSEWRWHCRMDCQHEQHNAVRKTSFSKRIESQIFHILRIWIYLQVKSSYKFTMVLKGVSLWPDVPMSPKSILPWPSYPKHMENESEVSPWLAKKLGTDIFSIPSPIRPLGAALSANIPVWILPHLP